MLCRGSDWNINTGHLLSDGGFSCNPTSQNSFFFAISEIKCDSAMNNIVTVTRVLTASVTFSFS